MKVYEYGARAPVKNLEIVEEQLLLAHRYYNLLVELEKERLRQVREVLRAHPTVEPLAERSETLTTEIEGLRGKVGAAKQRTRRGEVDPQDRARIKELMGLRKEVNSQLKAAKAALKNDQVTQDRMTEVNEKHKQATKWARHDCGVYWGTYCQIEQAVDMARKSKNDPRFRRWQGSGYISVQLQKGLSTSDVESDRRLQIELPPPNAWKPNGQKASRTSTRTVARLRVGSDGRDPIWTEVPIVMHRPLPPGKIKWAHLRRKRAYASQIHTTEVRGKRFHDDRWTLQLVVDEEPKQAETEAHGICGVDLGWRSMEDGSIRVAVAEGEGHADELRLPAALSGLAERSRSLRATCDELLDAVKPVLLAEIEAGRLPLDPASVRMWRAPTRLGRAWRQHGRDLSEDAQAQIKHTLQRLRHLVQWRAACDRQLGRRRLELYRQWAARVAGRFHVAAVEDIDLRELARREPVEDGSATGKRPPQANRVLAAPSVARACLVQAVEARRGRVVTVPAAFTTTDCSACGSREEWDRNELWHTCSNCGRRWDQDYNAARNLARAGASAVSEEGAGEPEDATRTTLSARQRRFRGLAEEASA